MNYSDFSWVQDKNLINIGVLQALARGLILRAFWRMQLDIERQDEAKRDLEESKGFLEELRRGAEKDAADALATKIQALDLQIHDDSDRIDGR